MEDHDADAGIPRGILMDAICKPVSYRMEAMADDGLYIAALDDFDRFEEETEFAENVLGSWYKVTIICSLDMDTVDDLKSRSMGISVFRENESFIDVVNKLQPCDSLRLEYRTKTKGTFNVMEKKYILKIYDNDSEQAIPIYQFNDLTDLTFVESTQKRYDGKVKYAVKISASTMKGVE